MADNIQTMIPKSALPSIEQVEEELTMLLDNERNRQK